METTLKRIKKYVDFKRITNQNFEKTIGFSNGAFATQLKNNKTIGVDKLENILTTYPEINPEWLLTGNGEMLKSEKEVFKNYLKKESDVPELHLIPIDAMAGHGEGGVEVMDFEGEIFKVPTFRGAEFLISVKGTSMYPKYNSGDIVACKKIPINDLFFQWNKVYVLDTIQGAIIKRIKKGSDENHILLVSENAKYDPFELHLSSINAVSIVMGVIRLE